MKKIFFALVAIFGLWSCVQEELPFVNGNDPVVGEGDIVVEGSIYVPAIHDATRTFGNESITKLDILVFDENGYLIQNAEGTPVGSFGVDNDPENDPEYKYKVALGQSNYKRTIHFVAYNDQNVSFTYTMGQHMRYVVDVLTTTDTNEAFWGVVDLPNGITGTKAENSTTFEPSAEVKTLLTKVPLVRNYANVTLTNNASSYLANAEIMLYNIPDKGSVVARITDSRYAQFAKRSGTTNTEKTYEEISKDYVGYEPAGMTLSNSAWGTSLYMYERHQQSGGNPVNTPAFAIIRGKYRSSDDFDSDYTYYKIDLCYTDTTTKASVLYNLLRNMRYNIILNSVSGRGESTPEAAAEGAAANNVSFSVETINLTNISDGERRLSVEYTEKVLTSGNTQYTLKYKYEPDIKTGEPKNEDVQFTGLTGDVIASYTIGTDDDEDGWRTFTFTSAAIDGVKMQSIVLTAGNLQRQVRYILGNPYTMRLDMVPTSTDNKVAKTAGITVDAEITIPTGLPDALFPMEIFVVAESSSLSSTLPVKTGLDSQGRPDANGSYFGYVVTYEADDYFVNDANGNRIEDQFNNVIELSFTTNMDDSSSIVNAYNPNFEVATDSFYCDGAAYGLKLYINGSEFDYGTGKEIPALLNINTLNIPIDDSAWTTASDSSDVKYFDFDFTYSNSGSVKLTGADFDGSTTAQQAYVVVVDNDTLRIYKNIYDDGIRAFKLTFETLEVKSATAITVNNTKFGSASDAFTNPSYGAITWALSEESFASGANLTLSINVPDTVPAELLEKGMELVITVVSKYTQIYIGDTQVTNGNATATGTYKVTVNSAGTTNLTFVATDKGSGFYARGFTISLTNDYCDSPASISKTKEWRSSTYE